MATAGQESEVDFTFDRGSLMLKFQDETPGTQILKIVGPNSPLEEAEVIVEHVLNSDTSEKRTRRLTRDEVREFIENRVTKARDVNTEERAFLSALMMHTFTKAKIRIWGPSGWKQLRDGNWPQLFRDRKD
jgi:hypothetical protein